MGIDISGNSERTKNQVCSEIAVSKIILETIMVISQNVNISDSYIRLSGLL
jgi:hypothetical protein